MNLKPSEFWPQRLLIILLTSLVAFSAYSKDPATGRAEAMSKISESDIASQSLRYKIIQSRMLILYMMDFLPFKGNPYFHMAEFASLSTLPAFTAAQETKSVFMNSESPAYWLPVANGELISQERMQSNEVAPLIEYFAQYVATAEIMEVSIQPVLKSSIIIGSIKETAGPDAEEKFNKAWRYIKHYAGRYKALLTAHPGTEKQIVLQQKQVMLLTIGAIAKGMKPHVSHVENQDNKDSLKEFLTVLEDVADDSVNAEQISIVKEKLTAITNAETDDYKKVMQAFESVDLPETGDIDGAEEAFEIAMRLEVGFDVLQKLINDIKETW